MFDHHDIAVILKALRFSAEKHRDQRRKDREASPYINHPIQVAEILWTAGEVRDIPTIVAALLHDTIEDTNTQAEEIIALFGQEVASLVEEVSDDKGLPKLERKRLQIESAPKKSVAAKQIKIADKLCNVADITNSPPFDWTFERRVEYLDWAERVVAGLRGANEKLEAQFDEALKKGRKKLEEESIE